MNNKNYYDEILAELKALIADKHYAEAFDILSAELKMPYIPISYEKQFHELAHELDLKLKDKKTAMAFSIDQIFEMLFSQKENEQIVALELIKEHNLRPRINDIKKRIETFDKKIKQAILFEILADQEIDCNIVIDNQQFNPINDSIMSNQEVIKAFSWLNEKSNESPQIIEAANNELNRYLLLSFPKKTNDGEKLASNIVEIVKDIIIGNIELTAEQKEIFKLLSQQ